MRFNKTQKIVIGWLALCLFLTGCRDQEREQQLVLREQAILEKEQQFALKEADYQALTKMRDSLFSVQDTSARMTSWPDSIAGQWSSRVVCTASTCSDYVIGDQRSDIWEFSSDSTQMVTKVVSNNSLVRVYSAKLSSNEIQLSFQTDSSASKQVDMMVILNDITSNKLKGKRSVTVDSKCNAQFTVELTRIPNQ
jgi:hypothetical protein